MAKDEAKKISDLLQKLGHSSPELLRKIIGDGDCDALIKAVEELVCKNILDNDIPVERDSLTAYTCGYAAGAIAAREYDDVTVMHIPVGIQLLIEKMSHTNEAVTTDAEKLIGSVLNKKSE
jgi:hypothetical protein